VRKWSVLLPSQEGSYSAQFSLSDLTTIKIIPYHFYKILVWYVINLLTNLKYNKNVKNALAKPGQYPGTDPYGSALALGFLYPDLN
jgi:hypothetical protein